MRKQINDEQAKAANRLKAAFIAEKAKTKTNYDEVGDSLEISAGAVSQYLNGKVAINMGFLLRFCALFQSIDPVEIYPELFKGVEFPTPDDPEDILKKYYDLDDEIRKAVLVMIENQVKKADKL